MHEILPLVTAWSTGATVAGQRLRVNGWGSTVEAQQGQFIDWKALFQLLMRMNLEHLSFFSRLHLYNMRL